MSANRTSSRDGGDSHHLPRDVSGNGRSLRRTSSTSQNRARGRPAKASTRSISNTGTSTAVTNRDDELEPDAEEEDDQPRTIPERQSRRKNKDERINVAAATQHHQGRTEFTSADEALLALGARGRPTVIDVSTQANRTNSNRGSSLPLENAAASGQITVSVSRLPADRASGLQEGLQSYLDAAFSNYRVTNIDAVRTAEANDLTENTRPANCMKARPEVRHTGTRSGVQLVHVDPDIEIMNSNPRVQLTRVDAENNSGRERTAEIERSPLRRAVSYQELSPAGKRRDDIPIPDNLTVSELMQIARAFEAGSKEWRFINSIIGEMYQRKKAARTQNDQSEAVVRSSKTADSQNTLKSTEVIKRRADNTPLVPESVAEALSEGNMRGFTTFQVPMRMSTQLDRGSSRKETQLDENDSVVEIPERSSRKDPRKWVKLSDYDGTAPWPIFRSLFEDCSEFNCWNEQERVIYLKMSLHGAAQQVLWTDGRTEWKSDDLLEELSKRFSPESQVDKFRAALFVRKRYKGETIESLGEDIARLAALAFPGPKNSTKEILAVDALIRAIGDPGLGFHMKRTASVKTLADAIIYAQQYEAAHTSRYDDDVVLTEQQKGRKDKFKTAGVYGEDAEESSQKLLSKICERLEKLEACMKDSTAQKSEGGKQQDRTSSWLQK